MTLSRYPFEIHSRGACFLSFTLCAWMLSASRGAAASTLNVDLAHPGHALSPTLYGIFFEDINCSADGGLYAELVRNRNFEDSERPDYWSELKSGSGTVHLKIDSTQPVSPKNPHSLKVEITDIGPGRAGVANSGFWGMSVKKSETYELSLLSRAADGFSGPLTVSLESEGGAVYASAKIRRHRSESAIGD